jgi:hypothetical protein
MARATIIGGYIEWNGFRVATMVKTLPASVRQDFINWIEGRDSDEYHRGLQDGRQLERESLEDVS